MIAGSVRVCDKKGVSLAVAWVLLLGLSISLAILVGTWLRDISHDTSDVIVSGAEEDQRCADTILTIVDYNCTTGGTSIMLEAGRVIFKNTGYFNITKVRCYKFGGGIECPLIDVGGEIDCDLGVVGSPLAPGAESEILYNCFDANLSNTEVIPFIDVGEVEIACADKGVKIIC